MGIAVYIEDQIHGRTYAGSEIGIQFSRILERVGGKGLLAAVHPYGDTMFNVVQLRALDGELSTISLERPEIAADIEQIRSLVDQIIRGRGYLWLSGD